MYFTLLVSHQVLEIFLHVILTAYLRAHKAHSSAPMSCFMGLRAAILDSADIDKQILGHWFSQFLWAGEGRIVFIVHLDIKNLWKMLGLSTSIRTEMRQKSQMY